MENTFEALREQDGHYAIFNMSFKTIIADVYDKGTAETIARLLNEDMNNKIKKLKTIDHVCPYCKIGAFSYWTSNNGNSMLSGCNNKDCGTNHPERAIVIKE